MSKYIVSAFIVGTILHLTDAQGCVVQLSSIYSREHANVTFQFTVSPNRQSAYVFIFYLGKDVDGSDRSKELLHVFSGNTVYTQPSITYIGDVSTGNISLIYSNVNRSEAGVYQIRNILGPDIKTQCVLLFILGTPDVPTVVIDRIPDEGEDVVLTCSGSRSTTVPVGHNLTMVYSWTVDDVTNPVNPKYNGTADREQFIITNVRAADTEKQITCRAIEDVPGGLSSANSKVVAVQIYYGPENIQFDPVNLVYEQNESSQFGPVHCKASCFPACTYRWHKTEAGRKASNNGTLYINRLNSNDAGTYICNATNPGRVGRTQYTDTKQLNISVIFGPDHITFDPPQDEYEEVENTILPFINCTASCYPACIYTWEKIGQTGQIVEDGILNLRYLQRSKAGIYRCTATSLEHVGWSGYMATRNLSLHVIYGPEMADISKGHSLTVTEGIHQANITCTSDCYPGCTSTWISITGGSADASGDVLSLGQVTRNHTGKYKCTTSNTDPGYQKTANATIDITVYYAPDITAAVLPNTELVENNYAELRCDANGVPNNYNYVALTQTWGNATIPNPRPPISTTLLHSSLRFDSLRLDDTGTYTCVVNNGVRDVGGILNQTSTIGILVQVSPKILTKTLTFAGAKSGNVRINVPFYSFPPANSINFTRQDGVQIQNSSRTTVSYELSPVITKFYGEDVTLNGSIAYLQITDIQEADFTNYTLDVTNTLGRSRTIIYFLHQSAPNKPTSFNRHVGEADVVVSWEAGFHGGNNQTFVIQLSKDKYVWLNHSFVFGGKNTTGFLMNSTLDKLSKGTQYYVRIYSFNINGSSAYTDVLNFTTIPEVSTVPSPQFGPIIGGVVGIVIILAIGAVVTIVVFKRRNGTLRGKKKDDMIIATSDREGPYTSMQYSTGNESEYLELNREQERSSNGNNTISQEGPYTSMQYSTGNESEYLEINLEQGQQQTVDRNVYVNLQLNAQ